MQWTPVALLPLICLLLTVAPAAARPAMGAHAKVVDSFLFAPDQSGSMMQKHKATGVQKIEMAKQSMSRINAKIPALSYQGALCLVAPYSAVLAPAAWDRSVWRKAINALPNSATIYGRMTPLGKSLRELPAALAQLPGKKALVLFTDGCDNTGPDTLSALQALNAAHPDVLVHVVSLADTPACQARLEALTAHNPASILMDARDIINTEEAAQEFVRRAFYNDVSPAHGVVSLREVLFASGSAVISPTYARQLDELASVMGTRPDRKVFIEGYADPAGSAASNQALSEKRAAAVRDYLLSKSVRSEALIVKGRGATDRYASYALDRRVEMMIIDQ